MWSSGEHSVSLFSSHKNQPVVINIPLRKYKRADSFTCRRQRRKLIAVNDRKLKLTVPTQDANFKRPFSMNK